MPSSSESGFAAASPARGVQLFASAVEITRPFTLAAPALGILSGALTAYGARPRFVQLAPSTSVWVAHIAVGLAAAALLNGASNVLNQACDLDIDRVNKPSRVLPSGRLSTRTALWWSAILYVVSLIAAFWLGVSELVLFGLAALATLLYSVPPFRTKRFGWWANVTIAIPRGVLLKVAGWSITKPALEPEAWLIGGIFGLFLLGATTTKDFADVEGDQANGIRTLPIIYGRERATRILYPFFTLPFMGLIVAAATGLLTGNKAALIVLGSGLAVWGHRIAMQLQRDPQAHISENHPSWRGMYYLMLVMQCGFAVAYLI